MFDFSTVTDNPLIPSPERGQPFTTPLPLAAREVAWADLQGLDGRTKDDTWSSYWWNDYLWVNGGLNRTSPGTPVATRRGFDVFKLLLPEGREQPSAWMVRFHRRSVEKQEVISYDAGAAPYSSSVTWSPQ